MIILGDFEYLFKIR